MHRQLGDQQIFVPADLVQLRATLQAGRRAVGLDPDRVEACAFAWLAMRTVNGEPGNAPGVTGASRETVLGAIHSSR